MPQSRFPLSRYIPKDAEKVTHPEGEEVAVVYTYGSGNKPTAIAYEANRTRHSWHLMFFSPEARAKRIERFFAAVTSSREAVTKRRKERSAPHTFKPGDIIYNSWGYDQTNVDFYEVTKVTAAYVWIKPISADLEATGNMSGRVTAKPGQFAGEEEKHKATGDHISFKFGSGSKWTGQPVHCSWYA